jgi:hypothetical protein
VTSPISPAEPGTPSAIHDGVYLLDVPIEWNEFCWYCNDDRLFFADRECFGGLLARCTHCGREKFQPFTRTVSEVA